MNHRKPSNRRWHTALIAGTTVSIAAVAAAVWIVIALLTTTG